MNPLGLIGMYARLPGDNSSGRLQDLVVYGWRNGPFEKKWRRVSGGAARIANTWQNSAMLIVGMHSNQLGLRGTEVALYDYAHFNETLLGNKSLIIAPANGDLRSYEKFAHRFEVALYEDFTQVESIAANRRIDALYFIKAGDNDGKLVRNCKSVVHVVFQQFAPHGDVYAYISEWLAAKMTQGRYPFVPHMIHMPQPTGDLRSQLNIPAEAVVYGYYGGHDSFSILFARRVVSDVAARNKNLYFIFMNVDPFCEGLENVIFLPGTHDVGVKANFINTCDACLHARVGGESFGLAIGEFSVLNKPIITFAGQPKDDMAHLQMLGDKAIIYNNRRDLEHILLNFDAKEARNGNWNCYQAYSPENVMNQFASVFFGK
jgi:hypothetical protein